MFPPWNPILVADGGVVARHALGAARSQRLRAKRLPTTHRAADGTPAWNLRNRLLIAEADVLMVFADKPREDLWHLIGLAERAGVGVEVHGADGEEWSPPIGPADARSTPFYIDPNCAKCGATLVLEDLLKNPDATADEIWFDEWMCPNHQKWCCMDWPRWEIRALRRLGQNARASLQDPTINPPPADPRTSFKDYERLAAVREIEGDTAGAVVALRAALDQFLGDENVGRVGDFQRIRDALRRLAGPTHPALCRPRRR